MKIQGTDLHIQDDNIDLVRTRERYGNTHTITAMAIPHNKRVDLRKLKSNESIVWGDGKTFYFLLTKKP